MKTLMPASEACFESTWLLLLWEWKVARIGLDFCVEGCLLPSLHAWAILTEVTPILNSKNSLTMVDVSSFNCASWIPMNTRLLALLALSLSSSTFWWLLTESASCLIWDCIDSILGSGVGRDWEFLLSAWTFLSSITLCDRLSTLLVSIIMSASRDHLIDWTTDFTTPSIDWESLCSKSLKILSSISFLYL